MGMEEGSAKGSRTNAEGRGKGRRGGLKLTSVEPEDETVLASFPTRIHQHEAVGAKGSSTRGQSLNETRKRRRRDEEEGKGG